MTNFSNKTTTHKRKKEKKRNFFESQKNLFCNTEPRISRIDYNSHSNIWLMIKSFRINLHIVVFLPLLKRAAKKWIAKKKIVTTIYWWKFTEMMKWPEEMNFKNQEKGAKNWINLKLRYIVDKLQYKGGKKEKKFVWIDGKRIEKTQRNGDEKYNLIQVI